MKKKLQNEELDDRAKRRNIPIIVIEIFFNKRKGWFLDLGGNLNSVPISFIHNIPSCIEFDKNHKWKKCENLKENTYTISLGIIFISKITIDLKSL